MDSKTKLLTFLFMACALVLAASTILHTSSCCPGPRLNGDSRHSIVIDWARRMPPHVVITHDYGMELSLRSKVVGAMAFNGRGQYKDVREWIDAAVCHKFTCDDILAAVNASGVDPQVALSGLVSLDYLSCSEKTNALLEILLSDTRPGNRILAIEWIGGRDLNHFSSELEEARSDNESTVREAAREALDIMDNHGEP